jgi:hypothetical protein
MSEPHGTEAVTGSEEGTTLTDEEIETRVLDTGRRAVTVSAGDDTGDTGDDSGDTGDDSGDPSDASDTGDDAGDVSDTGDDAGDGDDSGAA